MSDDPDTNQPTYTKVPNALLDAMADMGNAELRVALAIVRKIAGWGKECDVISLTQLETMTGLARQHIIKALNTIEQQGWITREPAKRNGFCYRLVTLSYQLPKGTSNLGSPDLVTLGNQSLVTLSNTQKKTIKKKKERESDAPTLDFLHEGVTVWKQLTGKRNITPVNASLIANAVTDTDRWQSVIKAWIGRGFRPDNVTGMLDWYAHPDKIKANANGHKPAEERPPLPDAPYKPRARLTPEQMKAVIERQRGQE